MSCVLILILICIKLKYVCIDTDDELHGIDGFSFVSVTMPICIELKYVGVNADVIRHGVEGFGIDIVGNLHGTEYFCIDREDPQKKVSYTLPRVQQYMVQFAGRDWRGGGVKPCFAGDTDDHNHVGVDDDVVVNSMIANMSCTNRCRSLNNIAKVFVET